MKRIRMIGLCLVAVFAMSAVATASASAGSYIVVLKDSVGDPGAVAAAEGKTHGFKAGFVYSHALKGYAASFSATTASAVAANPAVAYVAPDQSFHAACFFKTPSSRQCLPNGAHRIDAEQSSAKSGNEKGSVSINVAVVDSGIDATHPDLNVVGGVNCSNGKSFEDHLGHGTMVAGIIGAKDNTFGVVGVVPGANLWSARVADNNGTTSTSSFLCGIDWVTGTRTDGDPHNDIAVANMSIAGKGSDDGNCGYTRKDPVHQAICASVGAGVTDVVAAGNASVDFQQTIPAAYHEVLTATAMGDGDGQPGGLAGEAKCLPGQVDDTYAFFSNFATLTADRAHSVAAPGVCDLTTVPVAGCGTTEETLREGCYGSGTGTSFASPAVAGTVALCIDSGPCAGLTPAQIVKKIVNDAAAYNTANPGYGFFGDPLRPIEGKYYGYLVHAGSY